MRGTHDLYATKKNWEAQAGGNAAPIPSGSIVIASRQSASEQQTLIAVVVREELKARIPAE